MRLLHASSQRRQPASDQQSNQQIIGTIVKASNGLKEEEVGRAQELSFNLVGILKNPSNILGVLISSMVDKRNHLSFRLLNPSLSASFLVSIGENSCFRPAFPFPILSFQHLSWVCRFVERIIINNLNLLFNELFDT